LQYKLTLSLIMATSRKLKVGITGANGRVGTVLHNDKNFRERYDISYFTFEPNFATATGNTALDKQYESQKKVVDFSNPSQVKGCFAGLDVVIHLAAMVDVSPFGAEDWNVTRSNNFDATWFVFEECMRSKVKRIVFASSNHVQNGICVKDPKDVETFDASALKSPLKLSDPAFPDSMYAVAKLFGEDLGKLCSLQSKLESVILRIGWVKDVIKDDPSDLKGKASESFMRAIYLSHRDCVAFFQHAIEAPIKSDNGIPYMVAYACSNNDKKFWDLTETIKNLGYSPVDNAEKFFQ